MERHHDSDVIMNHQNNADHDDIYTDENGCDIDNDNDNDNK